MEAPQRDPPNLPAHRISQNKTTSALDTDFFAFLKPEEKKHIKSPPFFSENGLSQDIIQVTGAEPDICLEAFYALHNTLWPQIEKLPEISFKDAWNRCIGGSFTKGILCPPEKLMTGQRPRDLKRSLSEADGENQVFQQLDDIVNSISCLKQKVIDYSAREILYKKEIVTSLTLVQDFYLEFKTQVKTLVQEILNKEKIDASSVFEYDKLEDLLEPKAVMISDSFSQHWAYRIPRSQAQKILSLDASGRIVKSNQNDPANHRVIALPEKDAEPLVFFKANGNPPIQPEKEFMLYSLYRNLQIPVPETALLVLTDVFDLNPNHFYAVQASEAVLGKSCEEALQDQETIFDQEAYVFQTIGAFLTNPSDGSFKNFKYSPIYQTFIGIDNDLVFKPELNDGRIINVKSMLYLLPQIDHLISKPVKTFLTTLDPHLIILAWLQDLSQKNREYKLLFTRLTFQNTRCLYQNLQASSENPSLLACLKEKVEVDPEIQNVDPQCQVSKSLLKCLIEKLQKIQNTLSTNRSISTQMLFEEVSPVIGKYYQKLRQKFPDPQVALEALWGEYSDISLLLNQQELSALSNNNQSELDEDQPPEIFFSEYKSILMRERQSPLDNFIMRHSQRKTENLLNLKEALKELQLLVQEGLTHSHFVQDIAEFYQSLSKMVGLDTHLIKKITLLLSNLPNPELKWFMTLENYFLRAGRSVPKDSISVAVTGAFMKQRTFILTEPERLYLFDKLGELQKNTKLTGRSVVTCFPEKNPQFYLKKYPEWPGYEMACTLFMRLFGINRLPYHDLLLVKDSYPVLLTQKVEGDTVSRIWKEPQKFDHLDPVHTGLLIISAMLLNPEDGKEDNFILSPDGKYLIPIDNDHCFLPSTFQKKGDFWNAFSVNTALQTKTLLFCLDEMYMQIPLEVSQHILSLDFDEIFVKWMAELDNLENRFNILIDQELQNKFLEQNTVVRIPFTEQFIRNIYWKAHKIQDILQTAAQPTPFDLFKALEPFAAKCYQDSFKQGGNLQARFKAATDQLYTKTIDGSRVSILNSRTMMEINDISKADLQQDYAMFQKMKPLNALELFNSLIEERSMRGSIDKELLRELDVQKEQGVWTRLFGDRSEEIALKDFFASEKESLILKGSKLITSSKLLELFAQAPNQGMKLRFLSLPESPELTNKEIKILTEECPNIEYLNVSGCAKLKEIITMEGEWPLLSRLEAMDCLNLEKLFSESPIKILRIETNAKIDIAVKKFTLGVFRLSAKTSRLELSFKKGENFEVKARGRTIPHDDFVQAMLYEGEELEKLFRNIKLIMGTYDIFYGKDLTIFVTVINLSHLQIKTQDIKRILEFNLINLKKLDLSSNEILESSSFVSIIAGNWPKLNSLDLSLNDIDDEGAGILARGNWPFLEILNLKGTKITLVGVDIIVTTSKWTQLKHLNLSRNTINDEILQILVEGNWPLLEILDLHGTEITVVGIEVIVKRAKWTQLKRLDISENKLNDKALQVLASADWPSFEILNLSYTTVSKKGLLYFILETKWPNFKEMKFEKFTKNSKRCLLPKQWPRLEDLDLSAGKITINEIELIVNKCQWPQLKVLELSDNKITDEALEVLSRGNWPELEVLNLQNTQITVVGVEFIVTRSKWPQLKYLNLSCISAIQDETLEALIKAEWPRLEILEMKRTKITKKGLLKFILAINWQNLQAITFGWHEENIGNSLLPQNWPVLEELDLSSGEITQNEVKLIVNECKWPKLNHLNLSHNEVCDEGLEILSHGNWPLLEILNLQSTKITTVGVEKIVNEGKWTKLKSLNLSWNSEINDETLESLTRADWSFLTSLDLTRTKVTKKGLLSFILKAKCSSNLQEIKFTWHDENFADNLLKNNWPRLEKLDLSSGKFTQDEIKAIVHECQWPQLKHLDLSYNKISDEGLEALSRGNWPELEVLNLQSTKITAVGVEAIVTQSQWPKLKHLNLSSNSKIYDTALLILVQAKWPVLETLDLSSTGVTKKGLLNFILTIDWPQLDRIGFSWHNENFASSLLKKNWPKLEQVNLSWGEITQNEIELIVNNCIWPQLKLLDLSNNQIDEKGLESLANGHWPFLETLDLHKTNMTALGVEIIVNQAKWPLLKNLNLSYNDINDEALRTLCKGNWPQLGTLRLQDTKVTDKALASFLLITNWPNFKEIKLPNSWNEADKNLALPFIQKDLSKLERLDLDYFQITFTKFEVMIKKNKFKLLQLKFLKIFEDDVSFRGKISQFMRTECPLLQELHVPNTKLSQEGIKTIVHLSTWIDLRHLDLSNNEIFNEGLSVLTTAEWPLLEELHLNNTKITSKGIQSLVDKMQLLNLRKLDISENDIFDEGLKILTSAKWPCFQHLVYYETKVTIQGNLSLLENHQWPNFNYIEHSLTESFYNFNENLNNWSSPQCILANLPVCYNNVVDNQSVLVTVLDINWLDSKEITLLINHNNLKEEIIILPHEKLNQLESIRLSFNKSLIPFIVWPPNLKTLDLYEMSISEKSKLESLFIQKYHQLEHLLLPHTQITNQDIDILVARSDWPNLKCLNLSWNEITDDGFLTLASANWQFLEVLILQGSNLTAIGLEALVSRSHWQNLKKLDISRNQIQNEGLETLASSNWPLLEHINLEDTQITEKGLEILIQKSNWVNLKELDLSDNKILNEGLEILASSSKWQGLESLNLAKTKITDEGVQVLISKSNWPHLKQLDISWNEIHDEGLEILSSSNWTLLESLSLRYLNLSAKGISSMTSLAQWPHLKILNVSGNENIFNEGFETLASGKWPLLESLVFSSPHLSQKDIEILVNQSAWPHLRKLSFSTNLRDQDKISAIKKLISNKWPNIELGIENPQNWI